MTVQTYEMISYVAYALAILFFLVAILLFLLYDIPKVIGDVSGKTAKKAIEDIRRQNEESEDGIDKPNPVITRVGKHTDERFDPDGLYKGDADPLGAIMGTNGTLGETQVLSETTDSGMVVELDVTFTHTNEVIE